MTVSVLTGNWATVGTHAGGIIATRRHERESRQRKEQPQRKSTCGVGSGHPMSRWPIVTLHFFMSSNAMKNILTYLRSAESDAANFSTSWIVGSKGVPEPGTSLKPKSFSALR